MVILRKSSSGINSICPERMSEKGKASLTSKVKFNLDKLNDCLVITMADVKLMLAKDS